MTITNPQRKLMLKIARNPDGKRLRLKGGEWVAGRALKEKGLLERTFPVPALTDAGRELLKSLKH